MILGLARKIWIENASLRTGGWQTKCGPRSTRKNAWAFGWGNIGSKVAEIAKAFEMKVLAWSQNLTEDKATEHGAKLVSKEALFEQSEIISIHVILSERTRGLVGLGAAFDEAQCLVSQHIARTDC